MGFLSSVAPIMGVIGMAVAVWLYMTVSRESPGNQRMQEIAEAIRDGAMAFLRREFRILIIFEIVVVALLWIGIDGHTAGAFIFGAACSMGAGFFGMMSATKANVRTSEAARQGGEESALLVAFNGGAVMGLAVASLGLIGVGVLFSLHGDPETAKYINGFAMGASSIALFARVGGGIYTKAADVGSDLVGKVEAGIPEDDPRNPGVIADNVGDNVGDVAGMGADIFESYVGSMIATIAIAATLSTTQLAALADGAERSSLEIQSGLMAIPLAMAVIGLLSSFVGIFSMRVLKSIGAAAALRYSTFIAAGLFLFFALLFIWGSAVTTAVWLAVVPSSEPSAAS